MKFIFEPGDKFYAMDYSVDVYGELVKAAEEYCSANNLKLIDGKNINGDYKVVVHRSEFEDIMDKLRRRRIDELKSIRESLEYNSIEFNGVFYNADEISLMRLYALSEAMKNEPGLKVNLKDADNFIRLDCGVDEVNGIIIAYAKRANALNECYNKIKKKIMQAITITEVNSISTDDMYLVDFSL